MFIVNSPVLDNVWGEGGDGFELTVVFLSFKWLKGSFPI